MVAESLRGEGASRLGGATSDAAPGSAPAPTTAVVLCCRDQASRLRLVLRALSAQTTPPDEVVVVDDASSDGVREVVEAARRHLGCRLECVGAPARLGSAAARNLGAERTSAELLLFLDADALPPPGLLDAHLGAHRRFADTLVAGALWHVTTTELLADPTTGELFDAIPAAARARAARLRDAWRITEEAVATDFASVIAKSAPGAYPSLGAVEREAAGLGSAAGHPASWVLFSPHHASMTRQSFEAAGRFDPAMPFCEGWDLALRALEAGLRIRRLDDPPSYHLYHHRRNDFEATYRRWRGLRAIAARSGRRSVLAVWLYFALRAGDPYVPADLELDLDRLGEVLAGADFEAGAPFEILLRGHPLIDELEARARRELGPLGRRASRSAPGAAATTQEAP